MRRDQPGRHGAPRSRLLKKLRLGAASGCPRSISPRISLRLLRERVSVISRVALFVAGFVSIPRFGVNGATFGTCLILARSGITLSLMMWRYIGVAPWPVGPAVVGLISRKGA